MRAREIMLAGAVVVALTGFSVYWLTGSSETGKFDNTTKKHEQAIVAPNAARHLLLENDSRISASTSPRQDNRSLRWRDMRDKFLKAQSLRAFYYEAIQKPQDGGYFYAMQALGLCRQVRELTAAPNSGKQQISAGKQQEALARFRNRCDFTAQESEDALRQFAAGRNLNLFSDPLVSQAFALMGAKNDAARLDLLRSTIDDGNPELINTLLSPKVDLEVTKAFPGVDKSVGSEYMRFTSGLVECHLGGRCEENSARSLMLCAQNGWCDADYATELSRGLGDKFAEIDRLAMRLVTDIKRKNTAALVQSR